MKTDTGAAIEDRPDIAALLGPDAALFDMTSEFSPGLAVPAQHALHVRKGSALVREGCIVPVILGQTCTAAFLDPLPSAHTMLLGPMSTPQAPITSALLLAGSRSQLNFISHVFPALLFLKHVSAPVVRVYLGQEVPSSLVALVDDLAPLLSGGRPITIERPAEGTYEIEDCIFPTRATKPFFPAIFARRVILPFVLSRAKPDPSMPRRVYLRSRGHRTLVNEDQVAAWFGARGYESIDTDSLPFAEQVALIVRASHIVSLDGQSLATLAFAVQAQTIVILGRAGTTLDPMAAHLAEDYDTTLISVTGTLDASLTGSHEFTIAQEHLEKIESAAL
jgi:hypothetical protein